jgi:FkbM family methyltransferase
MTNNHEDGAMKAFKHAARKVVRRLGYEVVPTAFLEHHAFARHLDRLFRQLQIQCVLDVGANCGEYRDFLRDRVGFTGWIVSFEPVPRNIALLRGRAASDPRWLIQGYALGSEDGSQPFNVMQPDSLSSFLRPDYSKGRLFTHIEVFDHVETVDVRRLDSALGELRQSYTLNNPYLKLDTQGFDLEVIRGALSTLPTVRALQAELPILPLYKNAPSYREMLDALMDRGFEITAMYPVGRDERLRVMEFDCVMVNTANTSPPRPGDGG